MKIQPTVGRIVWCSPDLGGLPMDYEQPLAGVVSAVNEDGTVNLCVYDDKGGMHPRQNVTLCQEGDPKPEGCFCTWMPYQVGQAAKTEEAQKALETQKKPVS